MIEKSNLPTLKMLALASAIALTACSEQDPQQFIQEGTTLFEKGELESARVQFRNALQLNPKLAEAYFGLALLDEKDSNWKGVIKNIQEVLALDPNHVAAHIKLGFLQMNELAKAKEQAAIAMKLAPENTDLILLTARIKLAEKNHIEALRQVDRVLAQDEENSDALWLKASIFSADKRYEDALAILNRGIEAHPDNLLLGRLKIKVHMAQQNPDAVINDYRELLEKHPHNKTLRDELLTILAQLGKHDQVEQTLREAIDNNPSDVQLKLVLIDLIEVRDADRAESTLKEFIDANPAELQLKGRLAGYYQGHRRDQESKALIEDIVNSDPTSKEGLMAKVRLAEMALAQNDKATAERLVTEVLNVDAGNSGALFFRSRMRLAKQDSDGAIADLRIVLRDQPNSDEAMVLMAQAYALKGELEVAESHWRKALDVNPNNLLAVLSLTSELLKRGDNVRAEELLVKSLKSKPKTPALLELLVKVRAAKKDWVGAEEAVAELTSIPQSAEAGRMLSAMLVQSQGRHLEAIQIYKDLLSNKPEAVEPLLAMGKSYEALGQRSDFIAYLNTFIKAHPKSISAYHALGIVYATEKKWTDANKVFQEALKIEPESVASYKLLARVLVQQGKDSEVADLFREGLTVLPDNAELMMELARFYEQTKKYAEAKVAYGRLLEKFPNRDDAVNNLAYLLVESGDSPENFQQAVKLVERFNEASNPYFLDTRGWVLLKTGNVVEALEALKKAVAIAPNNADFRYHLGEAYFAVGDSGLSKVELEKSLELNQQNKTVSLSFERARSLLTQIAKPAAS